MVLRMAAIIAASLTGALAYSFQAKRSSLLPLIRSVFPILDVLGGIELGV